jgi:hypothetical protein
VSSRRPRVPRTIRSAGMRYGDAAGMSCSGPIRRAGCRPATPFARRACLIGPTIRGCALRCRCFRPNVRCRCPSRPATAYPDGPHRLRAAAPPLEAVIDVWWLRQYAGGLFLPLRDGTAGQSSSAAAGTPSIPPGRGPWWASRPADHRPELPLPPLVPIQRRVLPLVVAAVTSRRRRRGPCGIALQPAIDVVVVELLAPQHPGERLAAPHRPAPGGVQAVALRRQAQADLGRPCARHGDAVVQRALGAGAVGVDGAGAVYDVIGDPVPWGNGSRSPPRRAGPGWSRCRTSAGQGLPSPARTKRPSEWCSATRAPPATTLSDGWRSSRPHDHVLRNHSVGSSSMVCSSGAGMRTVTPVH